MSHLNRIMNSFLDGESLAIWTPLDENAMVVLHIAPETFVLLRGEVLRAPDEDSSVLRATCQVFTIGAQIQIFNVKVNISSGHQIAGNLPRTRPLWPFRVDRSQGC